MKCPWERHFAIGKFVLVLLVFIFLCSTATWDAKAEKDIEMEKKSDPDLQRKSALLAI